MLSYKTEIFLTELHIAVYTHIFYICFLFAFKQNAKISFKVTTLNRGGSWYKTGRENKDMRRALPSDVKESPKVKMVLEEVVEARWIL